MHDVLKMDLWVLKTKKLKQHLKLNVLAWLNSTPEMPQASHIILMRTCHILMLTCQA